MIMGFPPHQRSMATSFSKLFLNKAKIQDALASFDQQAKVEGPHRQENEHAEVVEYEVQRGDEKPAKLIFYFRKDSTTTITVTSGANPTLSAEIAG